MERWTGLAEVPTDLDGLDGTVLTIGVFDGVHRGHQRVIGAAVSRARELGVPAAVMTFDPHPMAVVRPDKVPPMLATLERRLELFEAYDVDIAIVLPFTKERSQQPAEEFLREVAGALKPRAIVVGSDFRFGFKATGDVALLEKLGPSLGFTVETLDRSGASESAQWSSTAVRSALEAGDIALATEILGHPFRVDGVVVAGADRGGRLLGFPTANVPVDAQRAVPADGIYAGTLVRLDSADAGAGAGAEPMPAAISVGTNPTFGAEPRRVESHVIDRDDLELYGVPVGVTFTSRLRPQTKFDDIDELIAQIGRDVDQVRSQLA